MPVCGPSALITPGVVAGWRGCHRGPESRGRRTRSAATSRLCERWRAETIAAGEQPCEHVLRMLGNDLMAVGRFAETMPVCDAWLEHPDTADYPAALRANV